jgi:hypothetical protein
MKRTRRPVHAVAEDPDAIRFRVLIRDNRGREFWEDYAKPPGYVGPSRGYGEPPMFTGDIEKFGREIVAWFNEGEKSTNNHRTFIRAELSSESEKG